MTSTFPGGVRGSAASGRYRFDMSTATLTARQEQFAHHYSATHNATDAARRAGYASGRANRTGYELLQKPLVLALVKELDAEKRAETGVDEPWITEKLVRSWS